ncbi:mucolipin-1 [Platysternon megacephalum]|uniref:Mucolipin-1 n=1 Tax=Platysternon megacephalum TaxID=55544 RepID=A0A4D9DQJ4_9SAUR|nr:mucolipin-1 [Platysternon megacephalum]
MHRVALRRVLGTLPRMRARWPSSTGGSPIGWLTSPSSCTGGKGIQRVGRESPLQGAHPTVESQNSVPELPSSRHGEGSAGLCRAQAASGRAGRSLESRGGWTLQFPVESPGIGAAVPVPAWEARGQGQRPLVRSQPTAPQCQQGLSAGQGCRHPALLGQLQRGREVVAAGSLLRDGQERGLAHPLCTLLLPPLW